MDVAGHSIPVRNAALWIWTWDCFNLVGWIDNYMASITFSVTDTAHLPSRSPAELGLSFQLNLVVECGRQVFFIFLALDYEMC